MAVLPDQYYIEVIGLGTSKIGRRILVTIAKLFKIDLEIKIQNTPFGVQTDEK